MMPAFLVLNSKFPSFSSQLIMLVSGKTPDRDGPLAPWGRESVSLPTFVGLFILCFGPVVGSMFVAAWQQGVPFFLLFLIVVSCPLSLLSRAGTRLG